MIDKTLRANLAVGLLGIVFAGFSGTMLYDMGLDLAGGLFRTKRMDSAIELVAENTTHAVEVSGFTDTERILVETTSKRGDPDISWHKYYYAVFDRSRTAGFYVYSDLSPGEFQKSYGRGEVHFNGIWEEMPRNIRLQEPMNRVGEQMRTLVGQGIATGSLAGVMAPLEEFKRRHPIRIDRRLNLHPARWRLEKSVALAGTAFFFIAGIAMVWAALRRRVQPV